MSNDLEIFLVTLPGLEPVLCAEAQTKGFAGATAVPGGVTLRGGWADAWRANLVLRGATRVLVRVAAFRAMHLAQLDKRARRVPWADVLRPDVPVRVDAACKGSRIYHAGAAAERVARAISETLGAPLVPPGRKAEAEDTAAPTRPEAWVRVRLDDDLCTISVDTSGELLHRRGHKQAVNKAPLRETLAALFLAQCGFDGRQAVVDPMCGSGTFVIEAAEIAAGLPPGRSRAFAFERLASFDPAAWNALRQGEQPAALLAALAQGLPRFVGHDRDAGAVRMSQANAERAGVPALTAFTTQPVSALTPPDGPPGLVMVNPPYGSRLGEREALVPLYRALGQVLAQRFGGWRVGLVTSEPTLARATALPLTPAGPPVPHGGLRITLYTSAPLP